MGQVVPRVLPQPRGRWSAWCPWERFPTALLRNMRGRVLRDWHGRLRTSCDSSIKMSKVGLSMLLLSRSDPLVLEFSPFMLDVREVVDSPAESPKCVCTWIGQELEAPVQNKRNRIVWFQELDTLVLSRPAVVRGAVGLWWGAPPLVKRCLDGGEAWTTVTQGVKVATSRSKRWKTKRKEN
jgi:hypothetical protein